MTLADRLKKVRGSLSQAEFARHLGLSQGSIGNYENATRVPDANTIVAIAEKFGVSVGWLLLGREEQSSSQDEVTPALPSSLPAEPPSPQAGTSQPDIRIRDEYISCLRQLADLQKENGDLRVKVAQLEARNAELERQLVESLKQSQPAPMGGAFSKAG